MSIIIFQTLEMFDKILLDEKCVTEIFLNNDCINDKDDIFYQMVKCLCNLSQIDINSNISICTVDESYNIQYSALKALCDLLSWLSLSDNNISTATTIINSTTSSTNINNNNESNNSKPLVGPPSSEV